MIKLTTTLLSCIALIQEALGLLVAAMCGFGVCLTPSSRREGKLVQLDRHTLTDIGFEHGSITWLR